MSWGLRLALVLLGAILAGLLWTGVIVFSAWGADFASWPGMLRFFFGVSLLFAIFCGGAGMAFIIREYESDES